MTFFILAAVIACISWSVTQEEIFREFRKFCNNCRENCTHIVGKKFWYLPTCHYCFSHYVTLFMVYAFDFKLVYNNWTGYIPAFFALVWIANVYMTLYAILRQHLKSQTAKAKIINERARRTR